MKVLIAGGTGAVGAKPPRRVPAWLAGLLIGEGGVSMMTRIRGGSNAKARRELEWQPILSYLESRLRRGAALTDGGDR